MRSPSLRRPALAGTLCTVLTVGLLVAASPPAATEPLSGQAALVPSLAAGFQRIGHPSGQSGGDLVDFVFLPDSTGATSHNLITLGRSSGKVVFVDDTGSSRTIATVSGLFTDGDFGLLSMSLAPDYLASGRIAFLGTYASTITRANGEMVPLSRLDIYRVDDPLDPTTLSLEKTVLDGVSQMDGISPSNAHGNGTVIWAPDGTFFAGFGDGSSYAVVDPLALRALDPDDLHGKILHIDEAGNGVAGNPFFGKAPKGSARDRMFASGLRNPFRFSLDPSRSNVLYAADVGWLAYEKVTKVEAGTVGGWPCFEGVDGLGGFHTPGYRALPQCEGYYSTNQIYQRDTMTPKEKIAPPSPGLFNQNRIGRSAAFIGGVFYQGDSYPDDYRGAYFFADFPPNAPSKIYTLRTDGTVADSGTGGRWFWQRDRRADCLPVRSGRRHLLRRPVRGNHLAVEVRAREPPARGAREHYHRPTDRDRLLRRVDVDRPRRRSLHGCGCVRRRHQRRWLAGLPHLPGHRVHRDGDRHGLGRRHRFGAGGRSAAELRPDIDQGYGPGWRERSSRSAAPSASPSPSMIARTVHNR